LNSLLPLDNKIVSIEYDTDELLPEIPTLKNSMVDVRCVDSVGRQFIVEMQMYWSESFKTRVLLNASNAFVKQLDKGKKFELLQPVYSLNFVNQEFLKDTTDFYHHYKIVKINDTDEQIEGLEFVFVELPKFQAANLRDKKLQVLWLRFMTEIDESVDNVSEDLLRTPEISEAIGYIERGAYTKQQLDAYDHNLDVIMTEISALADATRLGEKKAKVAVVLKAEKAGYSVENIALLTDLSPEQVTAILKEHK
jgi:predicted transposase/invertase (TIGR01784 family)